MRKTYGEKAVNLPQSIPGGPQHHTNLVKKGPDRGPTPGLQPVKTDGRIGSVTPPSYLKGGLNVDNNPSMGPPYGQIGSNAAAHMSHTHKGGDQWSPRVKKARALANSKRHSEGLEPVNHAAPALKPVKPT